jgi:hypothetical protein
MADLGCAVSDYNLILKVLQGLIKRYNHLRAIITCSAPLPSFHKVRDDLVLKEFTLGPNTPAPPPLVFYSNNTPTPPPPAPSRPLGNGGQGQGQGHDHGHYCKNGGGNGEGYRRNTSGQGNKGHHSLSCLLGPTSIILGLGPSTCTPVWLRRGGGSSNTAFHSNRLSLLCLARPWLTIRSHHPWILAPPPMYAAQQ